MKTVSVKEIEDYVMCPQRMIFSKEKDINPLTTKYTEDIRKLTAKFFESLMEGHFMNYVALRREWSKYWDVKSSIGRKPDKSQRELTNTFMTDEEVYIFKGLEVIKILVNDKFFKEKKILLVDHPFILEKDDIAIEGRLDMAYSIPPQASWGPNAKDSVFLVTWIKDPMTDIKHNIIHSLYLHAMNKIIGRATAGIVLDRVMLSDHSRPIIHRNSDTIYSDFKQCTNIAKAISQDLIYKHIGPQCYTFCPYLKHCLGVSIVKSKAKQRKAAQALSDSPTSIGEFE